MGKKKPKESKPAKPVVDPGEAYDQCMADIYDIMLDAYDKIGVRVRELMYETPDDVDTKVTDGDDDELY